MASTTQALIGLMIVILIAVSAVLPVIVDLASDATESQSTTGEAVTCTNATTATLADDDLLTGTFALTNGTVTIGSGNYTLTIAAGTVEFTALNNTIYGSSCVASYDYWDDSYLSSATSRTLVDLLPLLIAIGIVMLVVGYFKLN